MDFLDKFIKQALAGESLETKSYPKLYSGLEMKVSFGHGKPAHVPWIAFLGEGMLVKDGYYPAYLFYKKENVLILSYCISETNIPEQNWPDEYIIARPKLRVYF